MKPATKTARRRRRTTKQNRDHLRDQMLEWAVSRLRAINVELAQIWALIERQRGAGDHR